MSTKAEASSIVYEPEESEILTRMKNLMGGEAFHGETAENRLVIIEQLRTLVTKIRTHELKTEVFFAYQDTNFALSEYAFLAEPHPGLNVTGWRVFMVLMDPLQYGQTIGPPGDQPQKKWKW